MAVTDPKRGVHRLVTSTAAGAPLVIEDAELFGSTAAIAGLERRLIQAGFKGDAYETKLRAAVPRLCSSAALVWCSRAHFLQARLRTSSVPAQC